MFTQIKLKNIAEECAEKITRAQVNEAYFSHPFQHLVVDNFFNNELAQACLNNFPPLHIDDWQRENDADIEIKQRTVWKSEFDIPEGIIAAVRILNSSIFLKALASSFNIPKILPDPYFTGGGLNATMPGGLLDVHIDGNYHDATGLHRRINALVYLNPQWCPEWGGELGFYNEMGNICVKKIAPLFNRLVVFETHDYSFHGLPEPLNFPEGNARRSIILYYYTKEERPKNHTAISSPHSALWVKRGFSDKRGNKERDYM